MYFCCNSSDDITDVCRKFYGHLNSILSVVGRCANEMAAVHLIKTYRTVYRFLADRTNGRAIATLLRLSSVRRPSVCNVMYCG